MPIKLFRKPIFIIFQDNVVQRFNLVCGNAHLITVAETSFFIGNLLGVLVIGPVADWYGRKIGYLTFLTLWMVFSIASHFAENVYVWMSFRFVVGASSIAFLTASTIYRCPKPKYKNWF